MIYVGLVVALLAVASIVVLLNKPGATPTPTGTLVAVLPSSTPVVDHSSPPATVEPTQTPTPVLTPTVTPSPTPTPSAPADAVDMPFVPVVSFWSNETSISMAELRAAASGTSTKYPELLLPVGDDQVLAAFLGGSALGPKSVEQIEAALKEGALGLLRATDVTPRVHALAIDGASLFGNNRVTTIADWPLHLPVVATDVWHQEQSWTLVSAGDVMMDRGVAKVVKIDGKGGDYLFNGGTAKVTGIRCCSFFGYEYPTTERTGNSGALRDLISGANVATANLESAVLIDAPYHAQGFTFTADASLLDSVDSAGLDFMSLANNHVRNAGQKGIVTAEEELEKRGIQHSGAGLDGSAGNPGTLAPIPSIRVAIISCDAIRPGWEAGPSSVGTFNCRHSDVAGRIREVHQTADVVIVFPHWGHEYKPVPAEYQRSLVQEWFAAGADLVIGAHSHIAGAMGDVDGHVVFYSLGNLVFDQDFRQSTMMGVIPEMTWNGNQLVQIQLHPTLIIDAQPNLVAPDDGGQFVLDQMKDGSEGLLDY